jgi:hypothetical protein
MAQKQLQREEFPVDSPMSDFMDIRLAYLTRQQYIIRLKMFFDSLGLKGELDKQSREFLTRVRKDKEWAQNGLKYFIRDKKKRAENGELSNSTIRNFYKPVKLFCRVHDIALSWDKIIMTLPETRGFANDRAPTHEEIGKIIKYPDRRIKPLVLVTSSSGIRIGAWEYLKWKHIEPIRRGDKIVAAKITVYAGENEQYFSFITPEAFQALQEWMAFRRKSGEDINGESWLMITLWDTNVPAPSIAHRVSYEGIRTFVERALRAELSRKRLDMKITRRHEFKTNHGFRKFFQTNAEPKMKSLCVKTLMGQDTGLASSYYKPTMDELLEEYLKAVDNLTINKVQTNEEVIKNQQALSVEIQTKDREISELRNQMNEMRQYFKSHEERLGELVRNAEQEKEWQSEEDKRRRILYDMLDKEMPGWNKKYFKLLGFTPNLTKEDLERIDRFLKEIPED